MKITRRNFLKKSVAASMGMLIAPTIVPASVMGKNAPSNRIVVGAIGIGRISLSHDLTDTIKLGNVHVKSVCDVDANRVANGIRFVEDYYTKRNGSRYKGVVGYENYLDMLADSDIDAVLISTPDHQHAPLVVNAARAGKHVYCQKPTSLTILEGRQMSNAVNASGIKFQIGSQQRSMTQFRVACELVRNGRIGELQEVECRIPGDPPGGNPEPMPIPAGLNYDMWLGTTPYVDYTVDRVHTPDVAQLFSRPGWLRCEQFGAGMITGWGAHHFDIAHWGMGMEYSGPVEVSGHATFATGGLWDVHTSDFETEMLYPNGTIVRGLTESKEKPNGVLFKGSEGWIFVSRGDYKASPSDPNASEPTPALQASDPAILQSVITESEIHLYRSSDHHANWIDSIVTGKMNSTPAEVAHRSCSACLLQHIAMKLGRKLYWDPTLERFKNDDEANSMLSRQQRVPYDIKGV